MPIVAKDGRLISLQQVWANLGHMVAELLKSRAHVNIVIVIKDGAIQQVRKDQSYLPENIQPG